MLACVQESTGSNIEITTLCYTVRPSRWCNFVRTDFMVQKRGTACKTPIHSPIRMTKAWMNTLGWITVSDFLFLGLSSDMVAPERRLHVLDLIRLPSTPHFASSG